MRHIIIHYHIFKNAGTTFAAALERNFGRKYASFDHPNYNTRLKPQNLIDFVRANPNLVAISSHHLRPPVPSMEGVQFHEVMIIRNPLDRIRSMYDFYRRTSPSEDPLTRDTKTLSLPGFIEHVLEIRPNLITNAQVNLIANHGGKIPELPDAERAAVFIKSVAVVGVVHAFDLCAITAEAGLRPLFPRLDLTFTAQNVTQGRAKDLGVRLRHFAAECGPELFARVVELNRLDSQLLDIAEVESRQRFDRLAHATARLWGFRRRLFCQNVLGRAD